MQTECTRIPGEVHVVRYRRVPSQSTAYRASSLNLGGHAVQYSQSDCVDFCGTSQTDLRLTLKKPSKELANLLVICQVNDGRDVCLGISNLAS